MENKEIHLFSKIYFMHYWLYYKKPWYGGVNNISYTYIRIEDRLEFVRKIKSFIREFLEKRREKKDLESYLCNLPGDCSKIPNSILTDLIKEKHNKKRFWKPDEDYSWKDFLDTQTGASKERLKKTHIW